MQSRQQADYSSSRADDGAEGHENGKINAAAQQRERERERESFDPAAAEAANGRRSFEKL